MWKIRLINLPTLLIVCYIIYQLLIFYVAILVVQVFKLKLFKFFMTCSTNNLLLLLVNSKHVICQVTEDEQGTPGKKTPASAVKSSTKKAGNETTTENTPARRASRRLSGTRI